MEYLFVKRLVDEDRSCAGVILTDQMKRFLYEMELAEYITEQSFNEVLMRLDVAYVNSECPVYPYVNHRSVPFTAMLDELHNEIGSVPLVAPEFRRTQESFVTAVDEALKAIAFHYKASDGKKPEVQLTDYAAVLDVADYLEMYPDLQQCFPMVETLYRHGPKTLLMMVEFNIAYNKVGFSLEIDNKDWRSFVLRRIFRGKPAVVAEGMVSPLDDEDNGGNLAEDRG